MLQRGLRHDSNDARLVRVDQGRLAMGVLPMLQFTTSFTYYMQQKRRESLRARPYCLHVSFVHCKDEGAAPSSLTLTLTLTLPQVIFAHGKDKERKLSIFREIVVDPPSYYDPDGGHAALVLTTSRHRRRSAWPAASTISRSTNRCTWRSGSRR